jgi:hypothetical protein
MYAVSIDKLYLRSISSPDELQDGEYLVREITPELLAEIEAKNTEVASV